MDCSLPLIRAATHEASHAIAALSYSLPLGEVYIRPDGCGATSYAGRLGMGAVEPWVITAFAGPAGEADVFGQASTASDAAVLNRMFATLGLSWSELASRDVPRARMGAGPGRAPGDQGCCVRVIASSQISRRSDREHAADRRAIVDGVVHLTARFNTLQTMHCPLTNPRKSAIHARCGAELCSAPF